MIKNGDIDLIINTTEGKRSKADSYSIRASALAKRVPYTTTMAGATAAILSLMEENERNVISIQKLHDGGTC